MRLQVELVWRTPHLTAGRVLWHGRRLDLFLGEPYCDVLSEERTKHYVNLLYKLESYVRGFIYSEQWKGRGFAFHVPEFHRKKTNRMKPCAGETAFIIKFFQKNKKLHYLLKQEFCKVSPPLHLRVETKPLGRIPCFMKTRVGSNNLLGVYLPFIPQVPLILLLSYIC